MKTILQYIFFLLPFLAFSQDRTIADVSTQLVQDGGKYYLITTTSYEEGPPSVTPTLIGDSLATLTFLQTNAVNRQQEIAAAQKKVIEEKTLSIRQFQGLDTLVQTITGGTSLFTLNNNSYFPQLVGRYRIRNTSGTTNFTATLYQLANGAVRFRRDDNPATTYPVLIYSPKNFRVLNLPLGALPAGPYDCYEITPDAEGRRVWRDDLRLLTVTKIE